MTGPDPSTDPNVGIVKNLEEAITGYTQSAENWRPHLLRSDSLGECARRRYLHCLGKKWQFEEQLAHLKGAQR
ncbi:hypothetical protein ADL27_59185 [Streptomyces sp. NRRL F-6602]|nr:hypothetical protein ADL27_59185 [Streptomyces sp. NRRL F-6602]